MAGFILYLLRLKNLPNNFFEMLWAIFYNDKIVEWLDKFGIHLVANGSTRLVILWKDYAIKIAGTPCDGFRCNKQEVDIWKNATKKTRKYLCPVLYNIGSAIVVMKRAELFENYNESGTIVYKLRYKLDTYSEVIPSDIHHNNVGKIKVNGNYKPVIIDYGFFNWKEDYAESRNL